MKNNIIKVLLVLFAVNYTIRAQVFETSPFITIPGNNTNIDVSYVWESYICWLNLNDSVYTIYLKKLSPFQPDNIKIYSSTNKILNPQIAMNGNLTGVRVVWQSEINSRSLIFSREIINDSLTKIIQISDSSGKNVTPTVSVNYVAWINNGNLFYKSFDSLSSKPKKLDSINCSNPDMEKDNLTNQFYIVYEKGTDTASQICYIDYWDFSNDKHWSYGKISPDTIKVSTNPHIGISGVISYQEMVNGKWRAVGGITSSGNVGYNCEDPDGFSYAIIAKNSTDYTPMFMVYDADSLKNNKEIFLKPFSYSANSKLFNISNALGNDYSPHVTFYNPGDTNYIAIFWIHDENGKSDIWMSKNVYNPASDFVNNPIGKSSNFVLNQNYPNPFNPTTIINYQIPYNNYITLKIYDELGRLVKTLVNQYENKGFYNINFNGSNLASGIYFYQLKAGNFIATKKMLLLK